MPVNSDSHDEHTLTRRGFLANATATTAGLVAAPVRACPHWPPRATMTNQNSHHSH